MLIGATDPIAVIALLRELGVTGRLRLLIEAESLFNDGVAAVLFTLILVWAAHDSQNAQGPLSALTTFAVVAGGGLAAGFGVGLIAVMIAGATDDHLVETALTAVAAFGSFLIAEHFGASGVLATVATVPQPVTTPSPAMRFCGHAEIARAMLDEHAEFLEGAFVEEDVDALARGQLAERCCWAMRFSPPPRRALARRSSSSFRMSRMAFDAPCKCPSHFEHYHGEPVARNRQAADDRCRLC